MDFPSYYSYNVSSNKWKRRTHQPSVKTETISRLPLISPESGDVFYLRMLLKNDHCKGVKNETELRTINGIIKPNCMEICKELGLLQSNDEWDEVLQEACLHLPTDAIRRTLTYIIMYNNPCNLSELFQNHCEELSDDWDIIAQRNDRHIEQEDRLILLILEIEDLLEKASGIENFVSHFGLPILSDDERLRVKNLKIEL